MSNIKLEKMWDTMKPGWWHDEIETQTYTIYAALDGTPFACHLCGSTNKWVFDNEHVAVCEHEPISIGRGAIRQISSVKTKLIGRVEAGA